jgi:protein-S-isoprenylcysteine O-methyltransferase Ste14
MYLAILLAHAAAMVYAPGPWTVVPAVVSGVIHHRIVLAEEWFLADRFADHYAAYRRRVRRYL